MFSSWKFWILLLVGALSVGVFLSWIEKKSRKRMYIGLPAEYPTELVDLLADYFGSQHHVNAAYLVQILDGANNEQPYLIVGIEVAVDEFDTLQEYCENIVKALSGDYDIVKFVPLGEDVVSEYMIKQTEPFFRRDDT